MGKALTFTEHFFWSMVWVLLALIAAGIVLHFMASRGILPSVTSFIGSKTNLAAQAGGQ